MHALLPLALLALVPTAGAFSEKSDEVARTSAAHATTVEGVTEYRYPNGLVLLVAPDPSRSTTTVVQTILSGATDDHLGARGVGHLIEHVALMQTGHHPRLTEEMASRGASWGAQIKPERIEFNFTLPHSPENLAWALDVDADRLQHPLYTQEAMDREIAAIRQEENVYRTDSGEWLWRAAFGHSHSSHIYHQEAGLQDLDQLDLAEMRAYHEAHFRTDNALIVITGPLEPEEANRAVARAFSAIAAPDRARARRSTTPEPQQEGEITVRFERPGDQNGVLLMFRMPPASHPAHAALAVFASFLNGTGPRSLAATKELVRHQAKVTAELEMLSQSGVLSLWVQGDKAWPIEAMEARVKRALATVIASMTPADVETAKSRLAQAWLGQFSDSKALAFQLSSWHANGDWRLMFMTRDEIARVSFEDVAGVVRALLIPANCTTGLLIAQDAPRSAKIAAGDLSRAKVYGGGAPPELGEAFRWTTAELEARTRRGQTEGGLRYALTPVRLRAGRTLVLLSLRGDSTDPNPGRTTLMANMLLRGTQHHDRTDFEARLRRLEASLELTPIPGGFMLVADTYGDHAEAVVELLREALEEPRMDASELERLRAEMQGSLASLAAVPRDAAEYACFSGAPRPSEALRLARTAIASTPLEAVRSAHRSFLAQASGELVVLGTQDAGRVERLIRSAFARRFRTRSPSNPARAEPSERDARISVPHAKVGAFCATLALPSLVGTRDSAAVQLAATLLATAEVAETRLGRRLRLEDKLSYLVLGRLEDVPKRGAPTLGLTITYAPENEQRLRGAIEEELERAGREGFSPEEIETGKKLWLNRREILRSTPVRLLPLIAAQLETGTTFEDEQELGDAVRALTPEEVSAAVRTHFSWSAMQRALAGPDKTDAR